MEDTISKRSEPKDDRNEEHVRDISSAGANRKVGRLYAVRQLGVGSEHTGSTFVRCLIESLSAYLPVSPCARRAVEDKEFQSSSLHTNSFAVISTAETAPGPTHLTLSESVLLCQNI